MLSLETNKYEFKISPFQIASTYDILQQDTNEDHAST